MRAILLSIFLSTAFAAPLAAATLENRDAEPVKVIVTVSGVRADVEVAAGARASVCEAGCFVTFPNGEVLPLAGPEHVVYENGHGRLQP